MAAVLATACGDVPANYAAMRGFAVRAGNGKLRDLAGSPFASTYAEGRSSGYHYNWIGLRPAGDLLYLGTEDQTMRFKLDPVTGATTLQGASRFALGHAAAFSPAGRLYAAYAGGIQAFDIQPDTGEMVRALAYGTPSAVAAITCRGRAGRGAVALHAVRVGVLHPLLGVGGALGGASVRELHDCGAFA